MIWPKRPLLAFSVAETSVAEMSGPKRPRPKCPWPKCPTFVFAMVISRQVRQLPRKAVYCSTRFKFETKMQMVYRAPDKSAQLKIILRISLPKHICCVYSKTPSSGDIF